MSKKVFAILASAALMLSLAGCQKQAHDTTLDSLENCTHIEEYHKIPAELIRYVGNERVEREFNAVYLEKEGYNIVNFIKLFEIEKDDFNAVVENYGMRMNAETAYDVELLYSGDAEKIEEYFTKQ